MTVRISMEFRKESCWYARFRKLASLGLLIGLALFSFAALAEVYPIEGVWAAIDPEYPADRDVTCLVLKTFGVEAVSRKSIPELIIFSKDKRYDVIGEVQNQTFIKSIKAADGGFWITESMSKRGRWWGLRRKTKYFLKVVDPLTIEIWDGTALTRYLKCGGRPAI